MQNETSFQTTKIVRTRLQLAMLQAYSTDNATKYFPMTCHYCHAAEMIIQLSGFFVLNVSKEEQMKLIIKNTNLLLFYGPTLQPLAFRTQLKLLKSVVASLAPHDIRWYWSLCARASSFYDHGSESDPEPGCGAIITCHDQDASTIGQGVWVVKRQTVRSALLTCYADFAQLLSYVIMMAGHRSSVYYPTGRFPISLTRN